MFCQKCGKENPDGAAFCNSCGAPLIPIVATSQPVKKEITLSQVGEAALVFGILGGVLGVFGGIGGVIIGFIFGFVGGFIISYAGASLIDMFRS